MNILGIRVTPKSIYYAVFNTDKLCFENVEQIVVPRALITPEKLKYLRNNILDLLREYQIQKAGIKITEGNAKTFSVDRLYIEGVIQETFASSNILDYKTLMLSGMASRLKTSPKELKNYMEKKENQAGIAMDISDFSKEEAEAMLVAMAVAQ